MRFFDRLFFKKFLEPEEEIVFVIHKHWWTIVQAVGKFIALGLIFPVMVLLLYWHIYAFIFLIPWFIYTTIIGVQDLINWYHDALILTSKNVVNIDWQGFFHSSANRVSYDNIDGVEFETSGIIATLFQFGDLKVKVNTNELVLKMVPKARDWQKVILAKKDEIVSAKEDKPDEALTHLKTALNSLLSVTPEADPISYNLHAHQVMIMKRKKMSSK